MPCSQNDMGSDYSWWNKNKTVDVLQENTYTVYCWYCVSVWSSSCLFANDINDEHAIVPFTENRKHHGSPNTQSGFGCVLWYHIPNRPQTIVCSACMAVSKGVSAHLNHSCDKRRSMSNIRVIWSLYFLSQKPTENAKWKESRRPSIEIRWWHLLCRPGIKCYLIPVFTSHKGCK